MTALVTVSLTLATAGMLAALVTGWRLRRARRELARSRYLATHDPLTGLINRAGLAHTWHHRRGRGGGWSVLVLDLDGFKPVNDTHGHAAGDQVLTVLAGRLHRLGCGTPARLGGDEFAVLTADAAPHRVARMLARQLSAPVALRDGREVAVSASVGLAPGPVDTLTTGLARADAAMYRAKAAKTGVAVFDPRRDDRPSPTHDPRPRLRVRDTSDEIGDVTAVAA